MPNDNTHEPLPRPPWHDLPPTQPLRERFSDEEQAENAEWDRAEAIAAMREDAECYGDDSGPFDSYAYEGRIGGGL